MGNVGQVVVGVIGFAPDYEEITNRRLHIEVHHLNVLLDLGIPFTREYFHVYSRAVYEALQSAISSGWVAVTTLYRNGKRVMKYGLTPLGYQALEEFQKEQPDLMKRIKEVISE